MLVMVVVLMECLLWCFWVLTMRERRRKKRKRKRQKYKEKERRGSIGKRNGRLNNIKKEYTNIIYIKYSI